MMSIFNKFYKKEKVLCRTLDIDESLYEKLEFLSKNVYDASINKLVNAAIEEIIKTEDINFYKLEKSFYVSRSFLIRESFLESLYLLKKKYRISMYLLVNIAIKNAIDDWEKTADKELLEELNKCTGGITNNNLK